MRVSTAHRSAREVSIGLAIAVAGLLGIGSVAQAAPDPSDPPGAPPATSAPSESPDASAPDSTVPGSLIPPVSWSDRDDPDAGPTSTLRSGSPSPAARRGADPGGGSSSDRSPVSTAGVAAASFPGAADTGDGSALPVTGTDDVWWSTYLATALLAGGLVLVGISRRSTDRG